MQRGSSNPTEDFRLLQARDNEKSHASQYCARHQASVHFGPCPFRKPRFPARLQAQLASYLGNLSWSSRVGQYERTPSRIWGHFAMPQVVSAASGRGRSEVARAKENISGVAV